MTGLTVPVAVTDRTILPWVIAAVTNLVRLALPRRKYPTASRMRTATITRRADFDEKIDMFGD
jgi:hypothetical protein